MSTKIYTGLRLDNGDIGETLEMLGEQKQAVQELCNQKMVGLLAKRATEYVDALSLLHAKETGEFTGEIPDSAARMLNAQDDFYIFADEADRRNGLGEVLNDTQSPIGRAFLEIENRQRKCRENPRRDVEVDQNARQTPPFRAGKESAQRHRKCRCHRRFIPQII